jgi:hypothetical protein
MFQPAFELALPCFAAAAPSNDTDTVSQTDATAVIDALFDRYEQITRDTVLRGTMDGLSFVQFKDELQDYLEVNSFNEFFLAYLYRYIEIYVNKYALLDYYTDTFVMSYEGIHTVWKNDHLVDPYGFVIRGGSNYTLQVNPVTMKAFVIADEYRMSKWYSLCVKGTYSVDEMLSDVSIPDPIYQQAQDSGWKKDTVGWWYKTKSGDYVRGIWSYLDENWYFFDEDGYMHVGWLNRDETGQPSDNTRYYLLEDGTKAEGWQYLDGHWYYFDRNPSDRPINDRSIMVPIGGVMRTGWLRDGDSWYWLKPNGVMACDETVGINGKLESFDSNGAWIPR